MSNNDVFYLSATPEQQNVELLLLCAGVDALQQQKRGLFDAIEDDDERELAIEAIDDLQEPMVRRLAELRATTLEEHRARARSVCTYIGKNQLNEDANSKYLHERLTAAVLRDLAEETDADATLLSLCRQLDAETREIELNDARVPSQCSADAALAMEDGEFEALLGRWRDTIKEIAALPARTSAGIRTKAAALRQTLMQEVAYRRDEGAPSFEEQADVHELLAMSLSRDLVCDPPIVAVREVAR